MKKITTSLFAVALLGGMSTANAVPPETELGYGVVEGDVTADCGDFLVLNNNTWVSKVTTFFNKSGDQVRYREVGVFSHIVHYNSENPEIKVDGGPVDKYDLRDIGGGLYIVMDHGYMLKLPGGGGVFLNAGRLILDANTFELLSFTGRRDFEDPDALDRLCAAFAGP